MMPRRLTITEICNRIKLNTEDRTRLSTDTRKFLDSRTHDRSSLSDEELRTYAAQFLQGGYGNEHFSKKSSSSLKWVNNDDQLKLIEVVTAVMTAQRGYAIEKPSQQTLQAGQRRNMSRSSNDRLTIAADGLASAGASTNLGTRASTEPNQANVLTIPRRSHQTIWERGPVPPTPLRSSAEDGNLGDTEAAINGNVSPGESHDEPSTIQVDVGSRRSPHTTQRRGVRGDKPRAERLLTASRNSTKIRLRHANRVEEQRRSKSQEEEPGQPRTPVSYTSAGTTYGFVDSDEGFHAVTYTLTQMERKIEALWLRLYKGALSSEESLRFDLIRELYDEVEGVKRKCLVEHGVVLREASRCQ